MSLSPKAQPILDKLVERFGEKILWKQVRSERRAYVAIPREAIVECANYVFNELRGRLSTISAVDVGGGFELLYHFTFDEANLVLTLRCTAPKTDPAVDSITPLIPGAEFIEREIMDLFGLVFRNHPNPERLILAESLPPDFHPLRKDWGEKISRK